MKTLYLECAMGASGDMLLGALTALLDEPDAFVARMNALGLPGIEVRRQSSVKCGIVGTHMAVLAHGQEEESLDLPGADGRQDHLADSAGHHHPHEHGHHHPGDSGHADDHEHQHASDHGQGHHHMGLHAIEHIIGDLQVSQKVRQDALSVYHLIAQAEAQAHGKPMDQVHFHEVGTLDAVADVVGVALLMEQLAPDRVIVSPINTGFGHVRCAHGILPVPAPATATILSGVPAYAGAFEGELCTPTGAALLRHFADEFAHMPVMTTHKIGYGMGTKDFPAANCLRAFLGETQEVLPRIAQLECTLDDMTPEAVAYAQRVLMQEGALDVYTAPIHMKKGRPGLLLTCLCEAPEAERFARLVFRHTSTIGMRSLICERYVLSSQTQTLDTPRGPLRVKRSSGYGVVKEKPENDDLARIADEQGIPLSEVWPKR